MDVLDRLILQDDQWERISLHIIEDGRSRGSSGRDNRMFVEAALRIVRTGWPWCDLTEVFGDCRQLPQYSITGGTGFFTTASTTVAKLS